MDSDEPGAHEYAEIDFEAAAAIFVSAFPGATLTEVYARALAAAANCEAMGFAHEARVLRETAARIRLWMAPTDA